MSDMNLHPALAALNGEQRERMLQRTRIRQLAPGQLLFQQGEPAKRFYIVRSGHVKLFRISPQGQEKVIEIITPGQSFAEAALFTEKPVYPVCATALEDTVVEGFDGELLRSIIDESPATALEMLRTLSIRQHKLIGEIEALSLQNATLRVACYLLRAVEEGDGGADIRLVSQKKTIASRLSTQPETLSRILTALDRAGIVKIDGPTVTLLDPEALRAVASGERPVSV